MSPGKRRVYLGIGSNVDAEAQIAGGLQALRDAFEDIRLSPAYRTRAIGFEGHDFINLVAQCTTDLQPLALKDWLNRLEDRHGRIRNVPKFSDRTLDIDILLYDDLWFRMPDLELPRPEIEAFAHVLRPLADLAPEFVHPSRGRPLAEMWREFADKPEMETVTLDPMTKGT